MIKKRFSDSLKSDSFKVKLLSFLLAFGMWVYIMEKEDPIRIESMENVPVSEIINIDEIEEKGLVLAHDAELTVNVDVKGRRSSLLNYIRTGPKVKGMIEDPVPGQNHLFLSISAPSDIEYSFEPKNLYVDLEESIVSKESIDLIQKGQPRETFSIKKISINRDYAYVEGPKSQVDKVSKINAEIDVDGVNKDYSLKVRLIPVDSKNTEVKGVTVDREFIVADVKIEQSKEVPVELLFVNSLGEKVEADSFVPDHEKIVITGSPSKVQVIDKVFSKEIAIQDINRYNDRAVDLQYIEGISMSLNRVNLRVLPEKEVDYSFEIPSSDIRLMTTIREEEIRSALPEMIHVSFRASQSYQQAISEGSIVLKIDNVEPKDVYPIDLFIDYPVNNILVEVKEVLLSKLGENE